MEPHRVELLAGLSPDDARQILDLGTPMQLAGGSVLFHLGQAADRVYIIWRGRIALMVPLRLRQQDTTVLLEERLPGQTVGWSALIPPYRFTLDATAPFETEVLAIDRLELIAHLNAHPSVAHVLTRNVAEIMGQRLQVFQAMWLREMQQVIDLRTLPAGRTA